MDSKKLKELATENLEHLVEVYDLTEDDIAKAASYVPTVMKMAFVTYVRERCLDTLDISSSNANGETSYLPSRYKVNTDKKSRYLMAALVGMYLGKDYEREDEEDAWLMSVREYDMYAGGHIFEALNRMKNNSKVRDKCYNILSDYSELKYRVDTDIKSLLDAMNDDTSRLLAYINYTSSPESTREALEAATQSQELLDQYMAEHEKSKESDNGDEDKEL